ARRPADGLDEHGEGGAEGGGHDPAEGVVVPLGEGHHPLTVADRDHDGVAGDAHHLAGDNRVGSHSPITPRGPATKTSAGPPILPQPTGPVRPTTARAVTAPVALTAAAICPSGAFGRHRCACR